LCSAHIFEVHNQNTQLSFLNELETVHYFKNPGGKIKPDLNQVNTSFLKPKLMDYVVCESSKMTV
jgi:hypothetical protein